MPSVEETIRSSQSAAQRAVQVRRSPAGEALNSQGVPAPPALVRPEHRIEDLFHRPRAVLRKKRKPDIRLLARFLAGIGPHVLRRPSGGPITPPLHWLYNAAR